MINKGDAVFFSIVGFATGCAVMFVVMASNGLPFPGIQRLCKDQGYINISETVRVKCSVETLEWSEPTKEHHD